MGVRVGGGAHDVGLVHQACEGVSPALVGWLIE
jgi:hypothetical protein